MSPSPVYVLGVVRAIMSGDYALARWSARQAVVARAGEAWGA